ncbi:MAG: hypothetical protein HC918_07260 [Oscillatoriales cyanobacterium SM2_1_8]|nr:hypothetical protein [Oscillatoriales cyanobacterium SM2_1_8]
MGSPAFTLTVNGTNFVPGSVVNFNGNPRQTVFFSATLVYAQITAADVANIGAATITVTNPAPGGGNSNGLTLNISSIANPVPVLANINPNLVIAGDAEFVLTVIGSNFVPGAAITFNGVPRQTTFLSPNELTALIPAAAIADPGTAGSRSGTRSGSRSHPGFDPLVLYPRALLRQAREPRTESQKTSFPPSPCLGEGARG